MVDRQGFFLKEDYTQPIFLPKRPGMDIVSNLVACTIGRARLHSVPQDVLFIQDAFSLDLYLEHCFSVNRNQLYGGCHMYFAIA